MEWILCPKCLFSHLYLVTALWGQCYYLHVEEMETRTQEGQTAVLMTGWGGAGIRTHILWLQSWTLHHWTTWAWRVFPEHICLLLGMLKHAEALVEAKIKNKNKFHAWTKLLPHNLWWDIVWERPPGSECLRCLGDGMSFCCGCIECSPLYFLLNLHFPLDCKYQRGQVMFSTDVEFCSITDFYPWGPAREPP